MVSDTKPGNHSREPGVTSLPAIVADPRHIVRRLLVIFLAALLLAGTPAMVRQLALSVAAQPRVPEESDSMQISWKVAREGDGCLTVGARVVAIGVPRASCMAGEERPQRSAWQQVSRSSARRRVRRI